jgi:hypothetical protein
MHFFDGFADLMHAGYPVLLIKTYEFDRAYAYLKRYCKENDSLLFRWNCHDGLGEMGLSFDSILPVGDRIFAPSHVLEEVSRRLDSKEAEVYVLEGMADCWYDPEIKVQLRKLAFDMPKGAGKKHVVMVSPVAVLPEELVRYVAVLNLPLPGREELDEILKGVAQSVDAKLEEGLRYELVKAADGLTAFEAERAFRLAAVRDGFGHRALESMREAFLLHPKQEEK